MEQIFALGGRGVDRAPFVHVDKFSFCDVFVEVVVELPYHSFDLFAAHFGTQFSQNGGDLCLGEVFVVVGG